LHSCFFFFTVVLLLALSIGLVSNSDNKIANQLICHIVTNKEPLIWPVACGLGPGMTQCLYLSQGMQHGQVQKNIWGKISVSDIIEIIEDMGSSDTSGSGKRSLDVFRRTVESLTIQEREDLEERYAIMFYCGENVTKEDAFLAALTCVLRNRRKKDQSRSA